MQYHKFLLYITQRQDVDYNINSVFFFKLKMSVKLVNWGLLSIFAWHNPSPRLSN